VGSALGVVLHKNPIRAALLLVVNFVILALLYLLLNAQVIAFLQVLVYAGAIMVLFLFVIMLLNLGRRGPSDLKGPAGTAAALVLAGVLLLQLRASGFGAPPAEIQLPEGTVAALQRQQGVVGAVARPLFSDYLIPFEITSLLLLAAMVGAVVLAKRHL
jgi:NADH-quinone oxidoreductase subunit J